MPERVTVEQEIAAFQMELQSAQTVAEVNQTYIAILDRFTPGEPNNREKIPQELWATLKVRFLEVLLAEIEQAHTTSELPSAATVEALQRDFLLANAAGVFAGAEQMKVETQLSLLLKKASPQIG